MPQIAAKAESYRKSESVEARMKSGVTPDTVKKRFWDKDVAFPSRLVENMRELQKLYQLRYDVYCLQKGFLNPEHYPDNCEIDDFDRHSLHFGAFDDLGNALGTLRLVRNSELGFPMLGHCKIDDPDHIPETAGEISRLAVSKMIRKRQDDGDYGMAVANAPIDAPLGTPKDNRRRHRPDIVVGLYKSLYQESKRSGITHWIAAMEPSLLKLLRRFYFNFEAIGPEVDYYGPVRPYMVSLNNVEDQVYKSSKPFYASFVKGLPPELIRHPIS
ncbi:PEP-CTERM/exosortase system-associated acyltransferase [Paremcibacter congregatus]|uniref:PEP-CTERM/exosortase system-associated acyltransferase n=1 Tax=Paremcibacter congregatus TaxID=2043170 RepID=UPI0030ED0C57|tara:strand:- start:37470 stop:38285 length:816 start_codon:yes stop_codon:yes gene_type:complete